MNDDRIFLRDHIREIEIGAFAEERDRRQRVSFSISVDVKGTDAQDDDVDRILSYDTLLGAIDDELASARFDLLEALAEGIADRILGAPMAARVSVRIEKLDRVSGTLGIEISRSGDAGQAGAKSVSQKRAHVIYLAPGVEPSDNPSMVGAVVFICDPGLGEMASSTGRRIQLLESEIKAWTLVDRFENARVVSTRTELAYAAQEGLVAFWAPAKLVNDAGADADIPKDFDHLAAWFAQEINALSLTYVGCKAPQSDRFTGPVQEV